MEQETVPNVKKIFEDLPQEGKLLLISMSHASHVIGMKLDAIEATSCLQEKEIIPMLNILVNNNILQKGELKNNQFEINKNGDRYRLPINIRKSVLSEIIGLDNKEVEQLLKH